MWLLGLQNAVLSSDREKKGDIIVTLVLSAVYVKKYFSGSEGKLW